MKPGRRLLTKGGVISEGGGARLTGGFRGSDPARWF